MTKILLATDDEQWPLWVGNAFDNQLNGDLRTTSLLGFDTLETTLRELGDLDPEILVVGPDIDAADALSLARTVDEHRPDVSVVLIAAPSPGLLEQAVRVGVRDVIDPFSPPEVLRSSLEQALETSGRRRSVLRAELAYQTETAKVITVVSPKGGAGKTAIASNLAVGLARHAMNRVAIVDFDLQFGDVANALRLTPERTIADFARSGAALDATTVKAFLTAHPSGAFALCAPDTPAEADGVKPDMLGTAIDLLSEMFAYVVIDTAAGLDEAALTAIEHSTDLVIACATDVASARGLRKELEAFDLLGLTGPRRHFVLNRADARVGLSASDIESTVGLDVAVSIPSSRAVPTSMNQGSPILESEPRSTIGRSFGELVSRFVPSSPATRPVAPASGIFRRVKEHR
jgi:pilus assembly protein CpaE